MGKRHSETFHRRGYTDDKQLHERTSTMLVIREMQIKTTMKYYHTLIRMTEVKIVIMLRRIQKKKKISYALLVRM